MERISGLGALLAVLRKKAESARAALPQQTLAKKNGPSETEAARPIEALERRVRSKLRQLPPDALTSDSTKRMLVGMLLSWQFDERLQTEARFNSLVAKVQRSIDADPILKLKFERVIEQLSR